MRDRRGIRAARRRGSAGFSLIELMVVIMLIAIIAVIAAPAMRTARDDRLAFDYARQYAAVIHRASVRATARGAAHLVLIDAAGTRGKVRLFEAVDGTPPPSGPKQRSSCKTPGQWDGAVGWEPPSSDPPFSPVIDGLTLDTAGVNVDMNIGSVVRVGGADTGAVALCYTPGGNVYMGAGGGTAAAVAAMMTSTPFTGTVEVRINRRDVANNPRGLTRRVIVGGAAAPRIQSL